jgi:hypothetical protein
MSTEVRRYPPLSRPNHCLPIMDYAIPDLAHVVTRLVVSKCTYIVVHPLWTRPIFRIGKDVLCSILHTVDAFIWLCEVDRDQKIVEFEENSASGLLSSV